MRTTRSASRQNYTNHKLPDGNRLNRKGAKSAEDAKKKKNGKGNKNPFLFPSLRFFALFAPLRFNRFQANFP